MGNYQTPGESDFSLESFDLGEDYQVLTEIGHRFEEGTWAMEDVATVRQMTSRYLPHELSKFSPRLIGREKSLESIEHLKRFASTGVVVAIIGAILTLILAMTGGDDKDGGGSGGGGKAEDVKKKLEELQSSLSETERQIRENEENFARLRESARLCTSTVEVHYTEETLNEPNALAIWKGLGNTGKPTKADLPKINKVAALAKEYLRLIGDNDPNYETVGELFKADQDPLKLLKIPAYTAGNLKVLRSQFLNEDPAPFLELNEQLDAEIKSLCKAVSVVKDKYQSYMEQATALPNVPTEDQLNSLKALFDEVVKVAAESEAKTPRADLVEKYTAAFTMVEPTAIKPEKVYHAIYSSDSTMLKLLNLYAETTANTTDFNKDLETLNKLLGDSGKVIKEGAVKNHTREQVAGMDNALKSLIATAGTRLQAFSKSTDKIKVVVEAWKKYDKQLSAFNSNLAKFNVELSTESYASDQAELIQGIQEHPLRVIDMKTFEYHIPKNAILPHGIDIHGLRELVEEDSTEWTNKELIEYCQGCSASLESLHQDMSVIEGIHSRIQRTGLISRRDVQDIETIHPGLITNQTPIGRFTSFESVNYAQVSLENTAGLLQGGKVIAAVAGVAILAKVLEWCFKRFQASRDVTKSIKGLVEVVNKVNAQTIALITGMQDRVNALDDSKKGKLKAESVTKFASAFGDRGDAFIDFYELTNIEKSMMELRTRLVLYHHEKSLNELSFSAMTGGPIYDLANKMVIAIDKGIGALDKGLDHAAVQIKHSGQGEVNATESSYKNFDYGLHGLQVPGLKLPDQSQGNAAIAESLTAFIAQQKGELLGADGIKSKVEVDKLNANLMELAEKLKMLNGRVEKDAERIRKRLEKLAQDNQAGKETTQDKEIQDQRESIKTLLDGINHEFQAFSKVVGAYKEILNVTNDEVKKYKTTIENWYKLVKWHNDKIASIAKAKD